MTNVQSSLRRAATAAATDLGEQTPLDLPTEEPQALDATGGGGGSLVRTLVGLAIVIAVIYGLAWVLRQVKASREERTRGFGLSTEAVVALGSGRSLHLVRAGRELVLVSVAEHGVVPIRTYSEDEASRLGLVADGDGDDGDGDDGDGDGEPPGKPPRPKPPTVAAFLDALRERTAR